MFRILKVVLDNNLSGGVTRGDSVFVDSFKSEYKAHQRLDEIQQELQDSGNKNEEYWIEEYSVVKNGDTLIDVGELDYDFVDDFFFGRAIVRNGSDIGIINERFEEVLSCDQYSKIERFEYRSVIDEPAAVVHYDEDEYACYIDLNGSFIVRIEKEGGTKGTAGSYFSRVPSNGIFLAYNSFSKWVLVRLFPDSDLYDPYSYSYSNEGCYTFYDAEKKRFMLFGGEPGPEGSAEWSDNPYSAVSNFYGDVAIIERNHKHGLINSNEEIIVEPKYEMIHGFSNGLAPFETAELKKYYHDSNGILKYKIINEGGKWGFIDKKGNEVIPAQYDEVSSFFAGNAAFRIGNKWGFINRFGEQTQAAIYDYFFGFYKGGVAVVGKYGKYGLLSATLNESTGLLFSNVEFEGFVGNDRFDEPCFIVTIGGHYEEGYGWVDCDDEYRLCFKDGRFVRVQTNDD